MKEIGGYFGLEDLKNNEYYSDLIAVNNARNALVYVLKAKQIKKLYIPYFLCDSVEGACKREGFLFEYYHIDKSLLPIFDKELIEGEYLYVVNYFGQLSEDKIRELKNRYGRIILDNVQAFFQRPLKGIDTVYSCRKFFGVPDGGYVSTDVTLNEKIPLDVSMDRMKHTLGRYEGKSAGEYYSDFKANDASFKELELRYMSRLTHNIMGAVDYDSVCKKREENFLALHSALGGINKIDVKTPIGPYAYPLYLENGMEIKRELAKKGIFVPTLWPNVLDMNCTLEKDYAENILPLPVDQRYDKEDMERVINELIKYIKTENKGA